MSPSSRRLLQLWDQLVTKDGLLYRQYFKPEDGTIVLQLVVPESKREVLKNPKDSGKAEAKVLLARALQPPCLRLVQNLR